MSDLFTTLAEISQNVATVVETPPVSRFAPSRTLPLTSVFTASPQIERRHVETSLPQVRLPELLMPQGESEIASLSALFPSHMSLSSELPTNLQIHQQGIRSEARSERLETALQPPSLSKFSSVLGLKSEGNATSQSTGAVFNNPTHQVHVEGTTSQEDLSMGEDAPAFNSPVIIKPIPTDVSSGIQVIPENDPVVSQKLAAKLRTVEQQGASSVSFSQLGSHVILSADKEASPTRLSVDTDLWPNSSGQSTPSRLPTTSPAESVAVLSPIGRTSDPTTSGVGSSLRPPQFTQQFDVSSIEKTSAARSLQLSSLVPVVKQPDISHSQPIESRMANNEQQPDEPASSHPTVRAVERVTSPVPSIRQNRIESSPRKPEIATPRLVEPLAKNLQFKRVPREGTTQSGPRINSELVDGVEAGLPQKPLFELSESLPHIIPQEPASLLPTTEWEYSRNGSHSEISFAFDDQRTLSQVNAIQSSEPVIADVLNATKGAPRTFPVASIPKAQTTEAPTEFRSQSTTPQQIIRDNSKRSDESARSMTPLTTSPTTIQRSEAALSQAPPPAPVVFPDAASPDILPTKILREGVIAPAVKLITTQSSNKTPTSVFTANGAEQSNPVTQVILPSSMNSLSISPDRSKALSQRRNESLGERSPAEIERETGNVDRETMPVVPTIRVSIGRIVVRSRQQTASAAPTPPRRSGISLADYLAKSGRNG